MATLMEDPVILPSSKVTIDRQTIKIHLLSDPKDPFNREPLKLEDVVPSTYYYFQCFDRWLTELADTELKQQIEAWVRGKRTDKADQMDIDG